jgi:hypothetical protein
VSTTFERVVTGIPLWLLRTYLEELGGQPGAGGLLQGDGWRARLTQVEDHQIGSLRVGRVRLELDGEAEAVSRVRQALEPRLMRAGG